VMAGSPSRKAGSVQTSTVCCTSFVASIRPSGFLGTEPRRPAQSQLGKGSRHVVHGDGAERAVLVERQHAEIGGAKLGRLRQDGPENGIELPRRARYDAQHLRRRRLLLKRLGEIIRALVQLVEQPRVLDGDDGLAGEARDQRDLLVGKRAHLLTVQGEHADQLVLLEHRHEEDGAHSSQLDAGDHCRQTLPGVALFRCRIGEVNHRLARYHAAHGRFRFRTEWRLPAGFGERCRSVMRGGQGQSVTVPAVDVAELGVANPRCLLQHGGKHRLEVAGRAADDLKHLGRGGLLLQRFRQLLRALLLGLEQPRVLDGNHRLVGKGGDQLYLLVSKRVHRIAVDQKDADHRPVAQERHSEDRPDPECPLIVGRLVFGISKHVSNMNRFALRCDAPGHAAAARS
jgi:hypothetical protein